MDVLYILGSSKNSSDPGSEEKLINVFPTLEALQKYAHDHRVQKHDAITEINWVQHPRNENEWIGLYSDIDLSCEECGRINYRHVTLGAKRVRFNQDTQEETG